MNGTNCLVLNNDASVAQTKIAHCRDRKHTKRLSTITGVLLLGSFSIGSAFAAPSTNNRLLNIDPSSNVQSNQDIHIAMLAPQKNSARVDMNQNIEVAPSKEVSLTLNNNKLLRFSIDRNVFHGMEKSSDAIHGKGRKVILTPQGKDQVISGVVNNEGVTQAKGVSNQNGTIFLHSGNTPSANDDTI